MTRTVKKVTTYTCDLCTKVFSPATKATAAKPAEVRISLPPGYYSGKAYDAGSASFKGDLCDTCAGRLHYYLGDTIRTFATAARDAKPRAVKSA